MTDQKHIAYYERMIQRYLTKSEEMIQLIHNKSKEALDNGTINDPLGWYQRNRPEYIQKYEHYVHKMNHFQKLLEEAYN